MSFRHAPRAKQTSTTTGTGTITLIAPSSEFQSFNSAFGAGPVKVRYVVAGSSYWEIGLGTFDNSGPSLARDTVIASSAGGSAVSLPAATHDVFVWEEANWPVDVRTGSPTIALADLFGLILYTGTGGTLALPALANVPAGITFPVINLGTGVLIIDPNSSEMINGATTLVLLPGEAALVGVRDTATAQWVALVAQQRRKRNAQTGTSYTYAVTDHGKHVTHANASAIAGTLPQATTAGFGDGFEMFVENLGAGDLTITPTTSTINGGSALVLRQGEWALVTSDGTNYRAITTGRITGQPSAREIGTRGVPQNLQNAAYTFALSDAGGQVFHDEATARVWSIPANASVPFPVGTAITLVNNAGTGDITLAITTDTLRRGDGVAGTGSRTIKASSIATILKTKATEWLVAGSFL
jgi:hypothetical protein